MNLSWCCIWFCAPGGRGLPSPVRQTIAKALDKTINDHSLKKIVDEAGAFIDYLPGVAFAKEIEEEYNQILKIAQTIKVRK